MHEQVNELLARAKAAAGEYGCTHTPRFLDEASDDETALCSVFAAADEILFLYPPSPSERSLAAFETATSFLRDVTTLADELAISADIPRAMFVPRTPQPRSSA